jgi:nucleoside-diphosphate-sugar epimerase
LLGHPQLRVLQGDLAGDLVLPDELDAIVHVAATSPAPGIGAADFVRDNALATLRLAQHGRRTGARKFIYFSSLSVFGRITGDCVDESTPITDPDPYGATKLIGEQLLADEAERFSSIALRLPGVIGPQSVRNWLSTVLTKAQAGEAIELYNPGARFNNAVYINDLAEFVATLLGHDWRGFDVLTLGAAGESTIGDIVEAIVAGTGGRSTVRILDVERPAFIISSRKAIDRYGYRPRSIDDMVARFIGGGGQTP